MLIITWLISLSPLLSTLSLAQGDANEDGSITSADITCVILGLFGMSCPMPDCNEDGSVTSADITCQILAILAPPEEVDMGQIEFGLENAFPDFSFDQPIDLQNSGDRTGRLFVAEQKGTIQVLFNDSLLIQTNDINTKTVFLDIQERVFFDGNELGMLGLAFHPDYENNGFFYVNYTADMPLRTVISRFNVSAVDSNEADSNSETIILKFEQPFILHNGGQLAFGPDGYLYIAVGDGGPFFDPNGMGQDLTTIFATILRIDVDNPYSAR